MRNLKAKAFAAAALLLLSTVLGASAQQTYSIGYAVRAILPENQLNDQVTYFDLLVAPDKAQTVQVLIKNREDREIQVAVEAHTAMTNENGVIEFMELEEKDPSMTVDFSEVVRVSEPVVTIPPLGQKTVSFTLTLPKEPFEGVLYGGLLFTMLDQEVRQEEANVTIQNIYRYVIGMRLRETMQPTEPVLVLEDAALDAAAQPAISLGIRNIAPAVVRGMTLRAAVYSQEGGEALLAFERTGISMAPHSRMPYKLSLTDGQTLPSGTYRVTVETEHEDVRWQEETTLTID